MPGAIQLKLPVAGDRCRRPDLRERRPLPAVREPRGGRARRKAQPASASSTATCSPTRFHIETGATAATCEVWGQDASWLMNLEEKTREWVDVTDANVASAIFGDYGITPGAATTPTTTRPRTPRTATR